MYLCGSKYGLGSFLRTKVPQLSLAPVSFTVLSLLWYRTYFHFTEYTLKVMEVEFEARRFGRFHLDPLLQFAALFFPWTMLWVGLTWRYSVEVFLTIAGRFKCSGLWLARCRFA
jgi:hypothetical protein